MKSVQSGDELRARLASILCLACSFGLAGCGAPGPPQPPSLHIPERVTDLTAVRAGTSISLHCTMPKKTTDRVLLKGPVPVVVCWREGAGECHAIGQSSQEPGADVGADGQFRETLPAELSTGKPRAVSLFVELKNPKGKSAGLSNPAMMLAGEAPAPVEGFRAEVRADGVVLRWRGGPPGAVRLHRRLLTPAQKPASGKSDSALVKPAAEPALRDLFVSAPEAEPNAGALDKTARFGAVYEYTAQRVIQVKAEASDGKALLELPGEISAPVRVDVIDTFPPAVPRGLVAVFAPEEKTIDLSWQPDTEEDLAGYIVYRAAEDGVWRRISGPQPLIGPAYRDTTVGPAHAYHYAVSAIDLTGHESQRSAEATESVPNS